MIYVCGNSFCYGGFEIFLESGYIILSDKFLGIVYEVGICFLWCILEMRFDGLERERERKVMNELIDESRDEEVRKKFILGGIFRDYMVIFVFVFVVMIVGIFKGGVGVLVLLGKVLGVVDKIFLRDLYVVK